MKMSGSQIIPAPRELVWRGLNDPSVLQKSIPGCQKIEALSPTNFQATIVAKVGPVKATFSGDVNLSEINAPESYRISGKGQGGLAGFATGGASVKLTALGPAETQMDYDVDAQIGGKLAMLGSRLIDSTAQSLATQFFDNFAKVMKVQAQLQQEASSHVEKKPAKPTVKQPKAKPKKKPAKSGTKPAKAKSMKKPAKSATKPSKAKKSKRKK